MTYTKAAVTRNKSEKAILSILDTVSHSNNRALLHEFYDTTLDSLREAQNEVLPLALAHSRFVAFLMFFWYSTTFCSTHFALCTAEAVVQDQARGLQAGLQERRLRQSPQGSSSTPFPS